MLKFHDLDLGTGFGSVGRGECKGPGREQDYASYVSGSTLLDSRGHLVCSTLQYGEGCFFHLSPAVAASRSNNHSGTLNSFTTSLVSTRTAYSTSTHPPTHHISSPPTCPIINASTFAPFFKLPSPFGIHSNAFAPLKLPILELRCPPVELAYNNPSSFISTCAR
jgi:hypothetical protein